MNRSQHVNGALALALALAAPAGVAGSAEQALAASTVTANARLRAETVDDGVNEDADALTLRTRVGVQTGAWAGFRLLGEIEDVRIVGGYNDYAPENSGYAVVADPETTEINRAFLAWQGGNGLTLGLGRQRLVFDTARFVGNVGWRQNEQTFDAATVVYSPLPALTLNYAHVREVHGITPAFDAETDDHLLNLAWSGIGPGKLTLYGYLLDNRDSGASYDTYGARFEGALGDGALGFPFALEYATQEFASAALDREADYTLLEAGIAMGVWSAKLGREVLGSDGGVYGFQTPYATKHAFNGWADKFLATPGSGIEDIYVSLGTELKGVKLLAFYHDFSGEKGAGDLGSEWDLQALWSFAKHYTLGLKYASYDAEAFSTDTDKLWFWGEYNF